MVVTQFELDPHNYDYVHISQTPPLVVKPGETKQFTSFSAYVPSKGWRYGDIVYQHIFSIQSIKAPSSNATLNLNVPGRPTDAEDKYNRRKWWPVVLEVQK